MNLDLSKPKFIALSAALLSGSMLFAQSNAPAANQASQAVTGSNQQELTVTGQVLDGSDEPIIGASVVVEGNKIGAATDIDGNFALKVKKGDVLVISFIGYETKKVKVTDSNPLTIVLSEDAKVLDEVVVTALGIKKEAKSLSYNVQKVDNDAITRIADANVVNNLNGKVAGVNINASSAGVGGSSRVVMRGAKSINGNNNALYVVDGIPMLDMSKAATQPSGVYEGAAQSGDPISSINPEDIESISVLSGPSAAALYGSAAANGVIMITTKKGSEGATSVTISNNTTFSRPMLLPETQRTYAPSESGSFYSWGEKLVNPSSYDIADFFQTGFNVTNTASLTTGTQRNQTYLSLGTTNARGVVHNNNYERYNATVRNTTKMANDKLTMDLSFSLSQIKEKNMTSQGLYYNPLVPLYLFPAGDDFAKVQAYERYDSERNLMTQYWPYNDGLGLQNPYWITEHITMPNSKNRYMGTASFRYDFAKWINLTARARIDRNAETRERKYDAGTNELYASKYGYYSKSNISNQQVYGELLLSIDKYFLDNNELNLIVNAGANFEHTSYHSDYFGGRLKSVANLFTYGNVDTTDKNLANQYSYTLKKNAIFASAQVGYKSMAYLDLSARNDWSSTFQGTSTSSFFYPSVGLSGIITDIFNCKTDIMPFAKARISYSEVGNAPEVFVAIPTYSLADGTPVTQTRRPNSNLKPERTKSWELGFNFYFFQNKLKLDATLYTSRTYNQFFTRTLSAATGYTSEIVNGGRVDNKGIEVTARLNNQWGDWAWSTYLTYSLNKNKVVELLRDYIDPLTGESVTLTEIDMGGTSMYKMKVTEGGSIGDIYVNTLRTDEHGAIYVDPTTQTVVTEPDNFVKAGNASPKYNLGWGNDLSWKGFNLGFLFTARVGGIGVSQTQAVMDFFGASQASADARDNGGAIVNGKTVPAQDYYTKVGSSGNSGGIGSMYVYSATNVRLSELTFGYDFPRKWFGNYLKGLNLSFVGKNLFFIYRKAPYDPELTASTGTYFQGIDNFMTPSLRNLGFSVKVQF
jgi:TonB-linked SusC/RagA family outer membrane protein